MSFGKGFLADRAITIPSIVERFWNDPGVGQSKNLRAC